jgi:hypothetical protein
MRVDRELSDDDNDLQAAINVAWVLLCTALVFWEQARLRLPTTTNARRPAP